MAGKKAAPPKGCLHNYLVMRCPIRSGMTSWPVESYRYCRLGYIVIAGLTGNLLFVQRSSNVNSACNCTTYHGVVTDSEGHSCELCVRVHTAHSVGHISNGYRPYAVLPCVCHWTSIPYEAILCQNPGRNLPERRHTAASYNVIYPSAVSVLSRNFR